MKTAHSQKVLHNTQKANNRTGIPHSLPLKVRAVTKWNTTEWNGNRAFNNHTLNEGSIKTKSCLFTTELEGDGFASDTVFSRKKRFFTSGLRCCWRWCLGLCCTSLIVLLCMSSLWSLSGRYHHTGRKVYIYSPIYLFYRNGCRVHLRGLCWFNFYLPFPPTNLVLMASQDTSILESHKETDWTRLLIYNCW